MAFVRAAAARSLQSSLRHSTRRAIPRLSAPARTQLVQRRFASSGGHGEHQESSDLPWLLGAIVVTIPSCYYLWPSSSHAEHHGDGHGHDEHHDESAGGEGEEKGGEEGAASEGDEEQGGDEKSDEVPKGTGKEDASAESDKEFEEKEKKEQDAEPSKEKEGEVEEPTEKQEEEEKSEESTEPDMKADDSKRTVQTGDSRKMKKLPDSGQNIGISKNEDGSDKYHSGAKHVLPIQDDPSKSKKGEGSPETAKMHGTVDPARPAR